MSTCCGKKKIALYLGQGDLSLSPSSVTCQICDFSLASSDKMIVPIYIHGIIVKINLL